MKQETCTDIKCGSGRYIDMEKDDAASHFI